MSEHFQTVTLPGKEPVVRHDTAEEQAEAAARVSPPPSAQEVVQALEAEMTPRRLRDWMSGSGEGVQWWVDKTAEINAKQKVAVSKLTVAIEQVAKAKKINLVLTHGSGAAVLYADDALDITDAVVEELNSDKQSEKAK